MCRFFPLDTSTNAMITWPRHMRERLMLLASWKRSNTEKIHANSNRSVKWSSSREKSLKLHLESGAFCVRVFLSLRSCQVHQVQLRHSDVHHFIDGFFGLQSHGEHGVRSRRFTVHGGGGYSSVTPAHRQHLQGGLDKWRKHWPFLLLFILQKCQI